KDTHDGSTPAGNSMAATALLRLATLTGRQDLREKAEATLRTFRGQMNDAPHVSGQMLIAADYWLGPVQEFALIGEAGRPGAAGPAARRAGGRCGRSARAFARTRWSPSAPRPTPRPTN